MRSKVWEHLERLKTASNRLRNAPGVKKRRLERLLPVFEVGFFAVIFEQFGLKRGWFSRFEMGRKRPVFLGIKGLDLALPVTDHLDCH